MGGVLSRLGEDVTDIVELLRDALATGMKYKAVLQRASSDPGLPVKRPTQPYWMLDPPHPEMLDLRGEIPEEADVVIIGSGITGAAAARTILELSARERPKVVVLEARQLCSGATGRNGGHIKCTVYSEYARLEKKLGRVPARKIVAMQMSHLALLGEVGGQVPEGEVRRVETADLFIHQEDFDEAKGQVEILKEGMPEIEVEVWEGGEARKKFGVNEQVVGAVSYPAGALWPFRLVTGVWRRLVDEYPNLTISTHTSVAAVTENGDDASSPQRPFLVRTSRGSIQTRHVLHATNGFASHLVPLLRGRLTGAVGHMTAQRPGDAFPARHGSASWSVMYSPGFDYVTQRPDGEDGSPGHIMVGGALSRSREAGLDQFGVWDDGSLHTLPLMHLRGSMATVFEPRWVAGSELKSAWTGIMGFTGDTIPLVGPLPAVKTNSTSCSSSSKEQSILNSSGQWIAAGFNGEGMVWAWLSGTAVALMILGKDKDRLERGVGRPGGTLDEWFPREECAIDAARLRRADLRNLRDLM